MFAQYGFRYLIVIFFRIRNYFIEHLKYAKEEGGKTPPKLRKLKRYLPLAQREHEPSCTKIWVVCPIINQ